MRKIITMFVVFMMFCTLCACNSSSQGTVTEDKENVCRQLTDIDDWEKADKIINETVSLYRSKEALQYAPLGVYNLSGEKLKTYTFEEPNDFYEAVVMDSEEDCIMLIHNTGDHGISFWDGIYKGGVFVGLTDNYVLFQKDNKLVGISIVEKDRSELQAGDYVYEVIPFDQLSDEEQKSVVYPVGSTQNQF